VGDGQRCRAKPSQPEQGAAHQRIVNIASVHLHDLPARIPRHDDAAKSQRLIGFGPNGHQADVFEFGSGVGINRDSGLNIFIGRRLQAFFLFREAKTVQ
jgi:hypothetical protein